MITMDKAREGFVFVRTLRVIHLGRNPKKGGTPPMLRKFLKHEILIRFFLREKICLMWKMLYFLRISTNLKVMKE